MRVIGIDLAARAPKTALCVLRVDGPSARVEELRLHCDDALILERSAGAASIGVDAPLGWPNDFLAFVLASRAGDASVLTSFPGAEGLDRLSYRETDRFVHALTRRRPLSVSADKLGRVAMRCARLQAGWAALFGPQPLDGSGVVAEVYPGAAVRAWFPALGGSYKSGDGAPSVRSALLVSLLTAAPGLVIGEAERALFLAHDDAADAVLSALVALAVARGGTAQPPSDTAQAALDEGWIHVPTTPLGDLLPGRGDVARR